MGEKQKLRLTMDDLTLEEMELFEEATGKDILEVMRPVPVIDPETGRPVKDPDDPKGRPLMEAKVTTKAFVGLIFIALRRDNPDLTLAEVKKMKLSSFDLDLEESVAANDAANPTEAAPIELPEPQSE